MTVNSGRRSAGCRYGLKFVTFPWPMDSRRRGRPVMRLISFRTEDGGEAVVEIGEDEPGVVAVSRVGDAISEATGSLEAGLDRIRGLAQTTLNRLVALERPP